MLKFHYVFLILQLFGGSIKADLSFQINSALMVHSLNGYQNSHPRPRECTVILDAFSDYAANFTKCSIKHARPVRLCEKCIDHYVNFHQKYQELLKTVVNGTSCISVFESHDRLNVVTEYHSSILAMWNKGNCNGCFDWSQDKPILANSTHDFYEKYNSTMNCIIKNSIHIVNDTEEVCQKCMMNYLQLDDYYKSLSVDSIGVDSVCMDIVDSMNATRIIWSQVLSCCKLRRSPEVIFLCCTGIISALPLLFYFAVRFCGPIRDLPSVLKQSRFKQTILRSMERQS